MAKFNTGSVKAAGASPITAAATPSGTTYEGAPGYARDTLSALFVLAVSHFAGEETFYEKAADRDARYAQLVREATALDPEWTATFLRWLRTDGNMRSASVVGAAEFTKARLDAGQHGLSRQVIDSVLQRADEPGELLAYWTSRYGRRLPMPLKRGVSDAVWRLYTEQAVLKHDSRARGWRMADVVNMVRPTGTLRDSDGSKPIKGTWRGDLYEHLLDVRHHRDNPIPESLIMLRRRAELMALPVVERHAVLARDDRAAVLADAGMTWESLAGWLQGPLDAQAWESILPSMGYMARIRNLRNFDEAGVSDEYAGDVAEYLADPGRVARSRQLPFRFFSACRATLSDRWRVALGQALDHATRNLPELQGRTLILVDTSASMSGMAFSARSKMRPVDAAALFAVALGRRCGSSNVDLHGFADGVFQHPLVPGGSVLRQMEQFAARIGEVGHGTETAAALRATYADHDRVVILTDEQAFHDHRGEVSSQVPAHIPVYAFNLGGYRRGMLPGVPNRYQLGGLTDHTFRMIPLIEAGGKGDWETIFAGN